MSASKRLLLTLLLVLAIFGGASQFYYHLKQEKARAEQELSTIQTVLAQLEPKRLILKEKLTESKEKLESIMVLFPTQEQSIEIADRLLQIAKASRVNVLRIQTSSITKKLGDVNYQVLVFTLELTGSRHNLLDFIRLLNHHPEKFATVAVESVTLTIIGTEEGKKGAALEKGSATIQLHVYTRN